MRQPRIERGAHRTLQCMATMDFTTKPLTLAYLVSNWLGIEIDQSSLIVSKQIQTTQHRLPRTMTPNTKA